MDVDKEDLASRSQPVVDGAQEPATREAVPSAAFTPGPWSLEAGFLVATGPNGIKFPLLQLDDPSREAGWCVCDPEQRQPNARLIAAAPDLYEALRSARTAICFAAPPKNYGTADDPNLCYEARVPVAFVEQIDAALQRAQSPAGSAEGVAPTQLREAQP
jgi:hypothetical protein